MNKKILVAFIALFVGVNVLFSADGARYFSLDEAFATDEFKENLDPNIEFGFGTGSEAKIIKSEFRTKRKLRFFAGQEKKACQMTLLEALLRFEKRAKKMGASKVVNLISYYQQTQFDDKDKFMCWIINGVARVSLQGDVAH